MSLATLDDYRTGCRELGLTRRERGVLELMAEGLTNAGIAHRLVLSERTVEAHVSRVIRKLRVDERDHGHRRVLAVLAYLADGPAAPRRSGP